MMSRHAKFVVLVSIVFPYCTTMQERERTTKPNSSLAPVIGVPASSGSRAASEMASEMMAFERSFANQNCLAVMDSHLKIQSLIGNRGPVFIKLPLFFQMAQAVCEAKLKPGDPILVEKAAKLIQQYQDETQTLISKLYRDSALAMPKISPTKAGAVPELFAPGENVSNEELSKRALERCRLALNQNDPEMAINIIDNLPPQVKSNANLQRLRKDAAEKHVRMLRSQVTQIYQRGSQMSDPKEKVRLFKECAQLLEHILVKYPESKVTPAVKKNLQSLQQEIFMATRTN